MPANSRTPHSQPRHIPIEQMATVIAKSKVDIADDEVCVQALIGAGFISQDIDEGLSDAQDRAREIRSTERQVA